MSEINTLRIVLPKKGRLREDFDAVFGAADFTVEKSDSRQDFGAVYDRSGRIPAFEALMQRPGDALECLEAGVADMAIVGRDTYLEFCASRGGKVGMDSSNMYIAMTFGAVSRCAMSIAAPESTRIESARDLCGKRVATAYPALLKQWASEQGIENLKIITREGGVEDTVRLGLADAVFDVVQTGASLKANNLQVKLNVAESTAVLVQRDGLQDRGMAHKIGLRLYGAQAGVGYALNGARSNQPSEMVAGIH